MSGVLPVFPPEVYGGSFTAEEFAALPRPACPVCGEPVRVEAVDVTMSRDLPQRRYRAGRWRCTPECTPGIRRLIEEAR